MFLGKSLSMNYLNFIKKYNGLTIRTKNAFQLIINCKINLQKVQHKSCKIYII